jgi:hypothetical protein
LTKDIVQPFHLSHHPSEVESMSGEIKPDIVAVRRDLTLDLNADVVDLIEDGNDECIAVVDCETGANWNGIETFQGYQQQQQWNFGELHWATGED